MSDEHIPRHIQHGSTCPRHPHARPRRNPQGPGQHFDKNVHAILDGSLTAQKPQFVFDPAVKMAFKVMRCPRLRRTGFSVVHR